MRAWWAGGLMLAAGYGYAVFWLYGYWNERAAKEAAAAKSYRMDCPTSNLWDCTFTEVPVRVNALTDVFLPTAFWSAALLVGLLMGVVALTRYLRPVLPGHNKEAR